MKQAIICPSILSSDFAILAEEAKRMKEAGADWLHVDVMDGHFVPNLTLGAPIVKCLRKHIDLHLDCHLMVTNPKQWVSDFQNAGADSMTFHYEAVENVEEVCLAIKRAGMQVGVSFKPKTEIPESFISLLSKSFENGPLIDLVLIMTVEPGFGGQAFMPQMLDKVRQLRKVERQWPLNIQVDGGLDEKNVVEAAKAGANVIVAGTSIFKSSDPKKTISIMREAINKN